MTPAIRRQVTAAFVALLLAACGSGTSQTGPTTPSQPATPAPPAATTPPSPTPSGPWTITGRVVSTTSGEPIAGAIVNATVTAIDGPVTFNEVADGAGRFTLRRDTPPPGRLTATVSAPGYLTRNTYIGINRSTEATVDLIRLSPPFDLKYYQALARNGDESSLQPVYPWTRDATFLVHTVDGDGRTLEPEVLDFLRDQLPKAFRAWTNNSRNATVSTTTSKATPGLGIITVELVRGQNNGICGRGGGGTSNGLIEFNVDYCACGSKKIASATIWHEVGHAAGFYHVRSTDAVMYPYVGPVCAVYDRISSLEQFHSAIMYRRIPGNLDPDRDPAGSELLRPPGPLELIVN